MKIWVHFLFSLILAAIVYPIFNWKALLILAGGVLIDVDHYFWYVYKYKKFNLFGSYKYYMLNVREKEFEKDKNALNIFHSIEFLVVLVVFSFYSEFILVLTIGLLLHHLLDLVWTYFVPKQFIIEYSIIHWAIKNKIQKA